MSNDNDLVEKILRDMNAVSDESDLNVKVTKYVELVFEPATVASFEPVVEPVTVASFEPDTKQTVAEDVKPVIQIDLSNTSDSDSSTMDDSEEGDLDLKEEEEEQTCNIVVNITNNTELPPQLTYMLMIMAAIYYLQMLFQFCRLAGCDKCLN